MNDYSEGFASFRASIVGKASLIPFFYPETESTEFWRERAKLIEAKEERTPDDPLPFERVIFSPWIKPNEACIFDNRVWVHDTGSNFANINFNQQDEDKTMSKHVEIRTDGARGYPLPADFHGISVDLLPVLDENMTYCTRDQMSHRIISGVLWFDTAPKAGSRYVIRYESKHDYTAVSVGGHASQTCGSNGIQNAVCDEQDKR